MGNPVTRKHFGKKEVSHRRGLHCLKPIGRGQLSSSKVEVFEFSERIRFRTGVSSIVASINGDTIIYSINSMFSINSIIRTNSIISIDTP